MTGIEICLLVAGIVFFAASFMVSNKKETQNGVEAFSHELSEQDKEQIKNQVDVLVKEQIDKIVDEQTEVICERTEAQLDKISNIKTLELNEYAETVIKEINKNHNEAVFLYDMLNEKAKEVKNTVKDVNIVKEQIRQKENSLDRNSLNKEGAGNLTSNVLQSNISNVSSVDFDTNTEAKMDKMLAHMTESEKKGPQKSEKRILQKNEKDNFNNTESNLENTSINSEDIKPDMVSDKNEKILALYDKGMSNTDIAKTLGLGVGEVKLVVGLYKGVKQ